MAQFAASAFEGTEGDNLSTFDANWIKQSGSTGNAEIASGRARASTTATAHYYYNTAPSSADYSASVDVYNPGTVASAATHGPSVRMAAGANTSYHARISGAGSLQLYKFVAGTSTQLGSASKTIPASGTSAALTISVSGSTIDVTWNGEGSPAISVTDTSITAAGYPGLRWATTSTPTDTAGWQGDNFSADEAGGGGASQAVAFTLDDISAAVAQVAGRTQSLSASLDGVTFSASQVAGHSQTLAATLDGVSFSAAQSVGGANSQSLAVTLDGVQFAAAQTLGHAQSASVQLDDLTFSATQSASSPVKSQSLAVTLDDLQFYATQEGPQPDNLTTAAPGLIPKSWPLTVRYEGKRRRKHDQDDEKRIQEVAEEAVLQAAEEASKRAMKASIEASMKAAQLELAAATMDRLLKLAVKVHEEKMEEEELEMVLAIL